MEINGDGFLEELVSLGRETWEANPAAAFFSATWALDCFNTNPLSLPIPPTPYDSFCRSIKPDFGELFPAQIDYFVSPTEHDEGLQVAPCKLESEVMQAAGFNMGRLCAESKSKSKRVEGQPSKNLMAERRRKRLNDRLSMLRSVVPKISKLDRTSILGDTIDYMKELLQRIKYLQEEIDTDAASSSQVNELSLFKELGQNDTLPRNSPKFDVERRNRQTRVEMSFARVSRVSCCPL